MATCTMFHTGKRKCRLARAAPLVSATAFTQTERKLSNAGEVVPCPRISSLVSQTGEMVNNMFIEPNTAIPIVDKRVIVFDLKRSKVDDQMVSEMSKDGFGMVGYNMNTQFTGTESGAKNIMMYLIKYTTQKVCYDYFLDFFLFLCLLWSLPPNL